MAEFPYSGVLLTLRTAQHFDKLMEGLDDTLSTKNRDRMSANVSAFKRELGSQVGATAWRFDFGLKLQANVTHTGIEQKFTLLPVRR